MRAFIFFLISFTIHCVLSSQVLNWSSAVRTGSAPNYTYTGTGIKAVITTNAVILGDGTPRVDNASGNGACYSGLALYAGFFNSYTAATNSHITTTFSFAGGFGCTEVTLIIKDINADESNTTFCDVIELSATYGNIGTALPTASIVTTLASNINRSNSGTTVKLVGHNSSAETTTSGPYTSGTSCGNSTVRFVPPAGMPLKTFTIKYRPANGSSTSNAYYTSNPRPAAQYISYGNLSFAATSSCSQLLPIELVSFNANRTNNAVNLNWVTASEKNNDYFSVERSIDGIRFDEISKVNSFKNSSTLQTYQFIDQNPSNALSYYRLKQIDNDGQYTYSKVLSVEEDNTKAAMSNVYPNPTNSDVDFDFYAPVTGNLTYDITDYTGRVISSHVQLVESGQSKINVITNEFPDGIYFIKINFSKANFSSFTKLIKN